MAGLTLAAGGWSNNIIVYLISEFNIKSIDAAQIANIVNGCMALSPILGAILSDSYLGSFKVITVSSLVSMVGILVLTLTSTLDLSRPTPCEKMTRVLARDRQKPKMESCTRAWLFRPWVWQVQGSR
ncbi:putative ABC-type nitrate transporter [Helianthus anomalus]